MNKILRTLAVLITATATIPCFAHAKLQRSEPEDGSTVTVAPAAVKLHYNEPVEAAMSRVKFVGSLDMAVRAGTPALAEGDDKTLVVPVSKLPAGDYRVEWSTMGRDGHHTNGEVRFTVK